MAKKVRTALAVLGGVAGGAAGLLSVLRARDNMRVGAIWKSLEPAPPLQAFAVEMIEGLPAPARRYFLHAIAPGTPLASAVRLRMTGVFRLRPGQDLRLAAEEILRAGEGFVWKAKAGRGAMSFSGADYYAHGRGHVRFRLWGLVPLMKQEGPDVSRSSRGRAAFEQMWLPSALLPQEGVEWRAIDDSSAAAAVEVDGDRIELTFTVDEAGRLERVSGLRWGNETEDHQFTAIPFGLETFAERTFGGYTIPSELGVGWWFGTDRSFEFFRATVTEAEFL